jgi:hypothetical protein
VALLDRGRVASHEVVVVPIPGKSDFRFDLTVEGLVNAGVEVEVVVVVVVVLGSGMVWSTFTLRCLWCLPR